MPSEHEAMQLGLGKGGYIAVTLVSNLHHNTRYALHSINTYRLVNTKKHARHETVNDDRAKVVRRHALPSHDDDRLQVAVVAGSVQRRGPSCRYRRQIRPNLQQRLHSLRATLPKK